MNNTAINPCDPGHLNVILEFDHQKSERPERHLRSISAPVERSCRSGQILELWEVCPYDATAEGRRQGRYRAFLQSHLTVLVIGMVGPISPQAGAKGKAAGVGWS